MQTSASAAQLPKSKWTYVNLEVRDGQRLLNPSHVCFDRLIFTEPPRLTSSEVEVIVINGDVEDHRMAAVLPHDSDALEIPIRLLPPNEDARL